MAIEMIKQYRGFCINPENVLFKDTFSIWA